MGEGVQAWDFHDGGRGEQGSKYKAYCNIYPWEGIFSHGWMYHGWRPLGGAFHILVCLIREKRRNAGEPGRMLYLDDTFYRPQCRAQECLEHYSKRTIIRVMSVQAIITIPTLL